MFKVKAITHHAPDFLKAAYKHGPDIVVNTIRSCVQLFMRV